MGCRSFMRTVETVFVNIPELDNIPERERWKEVTELLREIRRAQAEEIRRLKSEINRLKKEIED